MMEGNDKALPAVLMQLRKDLGGVPLSRRFCFSLYGNSGNTAFSVTEGTAGAFRNVYLGEGVRAVGMSCRSNFLLTGEN